MSGTRKRLEDMNRGLEEQGLTAAAAGRVEAVTGPLEAAWRAAAAAWWTGQAGGGRPGGAEQDGGAGQGGARYDLVGGGDVGQAGSGRQARMGAGVGRRGAEESGGKGAAEQVATCSACPSEQVAAEEVDGRGQGGAGAVGDEGFPPSSARAGHPPHAALIPARGCQSLPRRPCRGGEGMWGIGGTARRLAGRRAGGATRMDWDGGWGLA